MENREQILRRMSDLYVTYRQRYILCLPQGKIITPNRLRREAKFYRRLEPYAGKLARTVLRGVGGSNVACLLDGYPATDSLYQRKKKQYPSHYTSSRTSTYKKHIAEKRMVADCVGLIKAFFWTSNGTTEAKYAINGCPDRSANGMFSLCKKTGPIATIPNTPG